MPGVLSHLSVAVVGGVLVWLWFNWKYGASFFIGTLIPDTIKFGIPAIRLETASFAKMMTDPLYGPLNSITHSIFSWIVFCFVILIIAFFLYKIKKLSWGKFKVWFFVNVSFLLAITIHLIMDHFIIEKSFWI